MSMAAQQGWTILGSAARFRAPPRGMLFGPLIKPPIVEAKLPEAEGRAVRERLEPVITGLDRTRQSWLDASERQLRLAIAGAAVAGLMLGWLFMGSLPIGLALMAGGALFAFLILAPKADEVARAHTKHAIVDVMADELLDLSSVALEARERAFSRDVIDRWHLLPPARAIDVDDLLEGERDGLRVSLSRVGFQFGGSSNVELKQGDGLVFVVTEVARKDRGTQADDGLAVVVGTDAPAMLRSAPSMTHGLSTVSSGDDDFDARYACFGDAAPLTAELRAGFAAIEAVTRCDVTGTKEVPAGEGLRPAVILRPGWLVVLTPVPVFDGVLEPPPFWEPLRVEDLLGRFASDLEVFDGYLTATMALWRAIDDHPTQRGITG